MIKIHKIVPIKMIPTILLIRMALIIVHKIIIKQMNRTIHNVIQNNNVFRTIIIHNNMCILIIMPPNLT